MWGVAKSHPQPKKESQIPDPSESRGASPSLPGIFCVLIFSGFVGFSCLLLVFGVVFYFSFALALVEFCCVPCFKDFLSHRKVSTGKETQHWKFITENCPLAALRSPKKKVGHPGPCWRPLLDCRFATFLRHHVSVPSKRQKIRENERSKVAGSGSIMFWHISLLIAGIVGLGHAGFCQNIKDYSWGFPVSKSDQIIKSSQNQEKQKTLETATSSTRRIEFQHQLISWPLPHTPFYPIIRSVVWVFQVYSSKRL